MAENRSPDRPPYKAHEKTPNDWSTPISRSDFGKKIGPNTNALAVP
jgi:hypothetical protein